MVAYMLNLNVTEVRDSDFENGFPGIFNFTVGILEIIAFFICIIQMANLWYLILSIFAMK